MRKITVFVSLLLILSLGQLAFAQNHAAVRLLNLSRDAGSLDVLVDGSRIIEGFEFDTARSKFNRIWYEARMTRFEFRRTEMGETIVNETINLQSGDFLTLAIVGSTGNFAPLLIADDRSTIADKSQVRLVHAAPDITGNVQLQVDGDSIADAVEYMVASTYSERDSGTSNLVIVDTKTGAVLASFNANLAPATNYSVYLVGQGADPLYRLLVDDKEGDYEQ